MFLFPLVSYTLGQTMFLNPLTRCSQEELWTYHMANLTECSGGNCNRSSCAGNSSGQDKFEDFSHALKKTVDDFAHQLPPLQDQVGSLTAVVHQNH